MRRMFTKAIVRPPAANFSEGLTMAGLGAPDYRRALEQHKYYCAALESCGLQLIRLAPDERHPDSCFVEDTAVIVSSNLSAAEGAQQRCAIITRPGALSRQGEVVSIREELSHLISSIHEVQPPGTIDGGDVCEAGSHFFIGISERTNEDGATQFATVVAQRGFTHSFVDIRGLGGVLHLKSGLAYLAPNSLIVTQALADRKEFGGYELIEVDSGDEYAANCIEVNELILMSAWHGRLQEKLSELGYTTIKLDMSEFQKMDGGLSCLSLRW
jgi:dimethylargininase